MTVGLNAAGMQGCRVAGLQGGLAEDKDAVGNGDCGGIGFVSGLDSEEKPLMEAMGRIEIIVEKLKEKLVCIPGRTVTK